MCIFLTMKNTIKVKWPVQTTIPIQWGEMDAFNHVNNVVYIRWCETARIELFRKIWGDRGINMKEILEGNGVGPILANFNVNYKIPISYPDNVIIQTRVAQIGNTSFNAAGGPLVHTIDDAIATLEKTPLEYLWLPETEELLRSPNV